MQLKFIIDLNYEKEMLTYMLRKQPERMKLLTDDWLDNGTLKNIEDIKTEKLEKILDLIIARDYKILQKYLLTSQKLYQKHWNEINNDFFATTQRITENPWLHKNYYCVVSLYHIGISDWGGNKIARIWKENPFTMRKVTAIELLISHFFTIFNAKYDNYGLSDKEKWSLAEILSWCIVGLEDEMIKFWPWIMFHEKYPLNHNYPQLVEWQKKIKIVYQNRKSFAECIEKGIKIIKN